MLLSHVSRRGKLKGAFSVTRNWQFVVCSDSRKENLMKEGKTRSKRKFLFNSLLLCAAVFLIAACVYKAPPALAGEVEYSGVPIESLAGEEVVDMLEPDEVAPTAMPSYYRSSYVTSVKNQGSYGTCWTFATASAMEANAVKKGITAPDGTEPDFSETAILWYTYNGAKGANDGGYP